MYFCVSEFEVGLNDCIFSGNEQQRFINIYERTSEKKKNLNTNYISPTVMVLLIVKP